MPSLGQPRPAKSDPSIEPGPWSANGQSCSATPLQQSDFIIKLHPPSPLPPPSHLYHRPTPPFLWWPDKDRVNAKSQGSNSGRSSLASLAVPSFSTCSVGDWTDMQISVQFVVN